MKKCIAFCLGIMILASSAFASVSSDIARLEADLAATTDAAQVKYIKAELSELYNIEPPVIRHGNLDEFPIGPLNDLCADAIAIAIPSVIQGTTIDATFDPGEVCGDFNSQRLGVWYSIIGLGTEITVTTCDPNTDYDTQIGVYTGPCDTLACLIGNDDACGLQSSVTFCAEDGVEYRILIHGFQDNQGDFVLNIEDSGASCEPPFVLVNDFCEDAIPLAVPSITQGNSDGATFDDFIGPCDDDGYATDLIGVWFTIVGTGHEITVSTCDEGTTYDTQLHIYEGVCGQLTCVAGDDDDPDCASGTLRSTATFCSEYDVLYHVLVNGYSGATGDYVLHVEDSGFFCGCIAPDELPMNIYGELPYCECVYVCGGQPMTLCLGPLGPHERPDEFTMTPGCAIDPFRVPVSGCDDDACTPITPDPVSDWTYDAPNSRWCMTVISANDGCFCFCLDKVLPVELNSFSAIAGDREVTLNWTTASETDNDHFDIVRDGSIIGRTTATSSATGSNYSWTEENLINGRIYDYTLFAVSISGLREAISTASATPSFTQATVSEYALHQNFPNPFNPETSISFDLLESEMVTLTVSNALGQTVTTLVNGTMNSGKHTVTFEAADMPSGLYFYRMEAGDFSAVRKMILMK